MAFGRISSALVAAHLSGAALAQPDGTATTVSWTADVQGTGRAGHATVVLHGSVAPGWHVYALKQLPNGPTPLLVTLAPNDVAAPDGAPTGSPPTKLNDVAFGFETQFYGAPFTLTLPVKRKPGAAGSVAVNVRFQTCNGRICQPPKTERLSAPVKG